MKAESYIYTGLHKPMTLFGIPPMLLMMSTAVVSVSFAVLVSIKQVFLAIPISVILLVYLLMVSYRKTRQDHHFVYTLLVPSKFWRGRKVRHLIAGLPPSEGDRQ